MNCPTDGQKMVRFWDGPKNRYVYECPYCHATIKQSVVDEEKGK